MTAGTATTMPADGRDEGFRHALGQDGGVAHGAELPQDAEGLHGARHGAQKAQEAGRYGRWCPGRRRSSPSWGISWLAASFKHVLLDGLRIPPVFYPHPDEAGERRQVVVADGESLVEVPLLHGGFDAQEELFLVHVDAAEIEEPLQNNGRARYGKGDDHPEYGPAFNKKVQHGSSSQV